MDPSNPKNPNIDGNHELQQAFLAQLQQDISNRLFEAGVSAGIVEHQPRSAGARFDMKGIELVDKLCVPSIARSRELREDVLSLVVVELDPDHKGQTYAYFQQGTIDQVGLFHPFPDVNADYADAVFAAAQDVKRAKDEGLLPDLKYDLLGVFNPRTSIRKQ